jgi:hypothetical protein
MITYLKPIHEEQYSDGSRTLGVLLNYNNEKGFKESFIYVFHHERKTYIFFDTMFDMFSFLLYGEDKMKRAYMEEEEFDTFSDAECVYGKFSEILKWV